jgi:hypothetical protein
VGRGEAAVPSAAATSEVGSDLGRREREREDLVCEREGRGRRMREVVGGRGWRTRRKVKSKYYDFASSWL